MGSRRIEITVSKIDSPFVRDVLENPAKCDLGLSSEKLGMFVEVEGALETMFFVTVPGPAVGGILETLKKNGIGVKVGKIVITTLDCLKPAFREWAKLKVKGPPGYEKVDGDDGKKSEKDNPNKVRFQGFLDFQRARVTTEELYNQVFTGANMTMNTWFQLIGASVMAAGGAASNASVFIVASMLVSPIMGPILGMTFGYRVADWDLFRMGFRNECKMGITAFLVGFFIAILIGSSGVDTYNWPTDVMMPKGQEYNLIISIIVSAAAGTVLAVSLTAGGANALVGTAISAGLLPPIVNAGMLISYSMIYCPIEKKQALFEMGMYSIAFYSTHVIVIIIVANIIFWLKDIDPRFKDKEDTSYEDIPSLQLHRQNLIEKGINPDELKNQFIPHFLFQNVEKEVKNFKAADFLGDLKNNVQNVASIATLGLVPEAEASNRSHQKHWAEEELAEDNAIDEINEKKEKRRKSKSEQDSHGNDEELGRNTVSPLHPTKGEVLAGGAALPVKTKAVKPEIEDNEIDDDGF